jgi:hypothetical protein
MWQAVCQKLSLRRGRKRGELIEGPWQDNQVERRMREIAERYETSDAHDRLALWLQHRDLRPLLSRLERGDHS